MIVGYELGIAGVAAGSGAAYLEFQSNATRRAKIRELGLFNPSSTTAAAATLVGRPGNTPTGGAVTVGGAQDGADAAATAGVTTTWTVAPTVPAPALRRTEIAGTVGSGVIFTWPSDGELIVGLTRAGSIIVWNAGGSAGPAIDSYFVWAE